MRKLSLAAAAVALVGFASPAAAANWSLCGTSSNGFLSCAAATASVSGTTLTVTVQNLYPGQGDTHRITGFGFYYTGSPSLGTATLDATASWSNGLGSLGAPGPDSPPTWTWLAGAEYGPGGNGILAGQSQVFTFTLSQALTEDDLARLNFAFRAQSTGPDEEGSTKCYMSDGAESEHSCMPMTAVPEPATLALMGTGLLGLAGVGALRRRRGNQAV